jgi:hypothetical protein
MSFKSALALALTAVAALPAAAAAQTPVNPPDADNYLSPYFVKQGDPLVTGDVLGIQADTTNYTVQNDMYVPNPQNQPGGGPREPTVCEGYRNPSTYGNTIWSVFQAGRYGKVDISAASGNFDEVIRVVPFQDPNHPEPGLPGACYDDLAGSQESATGLVFPGEWYAVQVGGTINATSKVQGGPMQVKFDMGPPPEIEGQAFLFWNTNPLRVTSLTTKGITKGARVTLTCTKHACKTTKRTASKPVWAKPVGAVDPVRAFRPIAHAAKTKFTLLKNKRVRKGATITLRFTADGFIGKHYQWTVKSNKITAAKIRCTNPGSSKPHKTGTCHG